MRHLTDAVLEPALWVTGEWSLRWAALIALLAVALTVCRPRRAATRHRLCLAVLLGGLALPAVPRWGPGWRAPDPPGAPAPVVTGPEVAPLPAGPSPEADRPAPAESMPTGADLPARGEPWGARRLAVLALSGLWAGGALLLLARWAGGCVYLGRLRRSAVAPPGPAADLFDTCRAATGLGRRARLACHPAVASPVALGFLRPLVLVPPGWADLPEPAQRAGLLHELAHLKRQDQRLVPLLELLRATLYFHLPLHWLLGRLERERELLCDEAAVALGVAPRELARTLLRFASRPARLLPAFGRRRTVLTRIRHLLEDDMPHPASPFAPARSLAAGAVVLGLALGLASLRLWAAPPAPQVIVAVEDPAVQPPKEDRGGAPARPAAGFPKEALRYAGKSFDQWRTELITELKPAVRADGMKALAAFGVNGYGAEATRAILELMRGYEIYHVDADDRAVVNAAFDAIDKIGDPALPVLREGLKDNNRNVRRVAADVIANRHPGWATAAAPELLADLRDNDPYVRINAIRGVGAIKPRPKEYLPALLRLLKDPDVGVRYAAACQVTLIGPEARAAVPALLDILNTDSDVVQNSRAAIHALAAVKPDANTVMPALIRALKSPHEYVASDAAEALGTFGPAAAEAVPALTALMVRQIKDHNGFNFVNTPIQALGRIGPAAREAAPLIRQAARIWRGGDIEKSVEAALRNIEK